MVTQIRNEWGFVTKLTRHTNHRVTRIDYTDVGTYYPAKCARVKSGQTLTSFQPGIEICFEPLLGENFPGREELAGQILNSLFRVINANRSLEIKPPSVAGAPVAKRITVEARAQDEDGIPIDV